jgi:hypothetical protein
MSIAVQLYTFPDARLFADASKPPSGNSSTLARFAAREGNGGKAAGLTRCVRYDPLAGELFHEQVQEMGLH